MKLLFGFDWNRLRHLAHLAIDPQEPVQVGLMELIQKIESIDSIRSNVLEHYRRSVLSQYPDKLGVYRSVKIDRGANNEIQTNRIRWKIRLSMSPHRGTITLSIPYLPNF